MAWPNSTDYIEAVQNLSQSMGDEELRAGQLVETPLGLPMVWSGSFADVYKLHNATTGTTWALKCFTRRVAGQAERYQQIAAHVERAQLPFIVQFKYMDRGIRVRGEWYPALKMRWVDGGIRLNEFVERHLDRPRTLGALLKIWQKLAARLHAAKMAHADLQHGNVLLVPRDKKSLVLRLIDYDGMFVPALEGTRSNEVGHPAFQHPQRRREGIYSADVDRFSHLAIYTAIRSLTVGGEGLWKRFNNQENLLFREEDFEKPGSSDLFRTLWELPDNGAHALVGRLALACSKPLAQTPRLDEIANKDDHPLTTAEKHEVESLLGSVPKSHPAAVAEWTEWMQQVTSDIPAGPAPRHDSATDRTSTDTDEPLPETQTPAPEPQAPAPTPRRRKSLALLLLRRRLDRAAAAITADRVWLCLSLLNFPRWTDRLLKTIAGEGNTIVHNFLRLLLLSGLILLFTLWNNGEFQFSQLGSLLASITGSPTGITNEIGMQFKRIPAGEFMMGSPDDDPEKEEGETPQHPVRITTPFYLSVHEVTQEHYEKVMGKNPSRFEGPSLPVEQVSWSDAMEFCEKLSVMDAENDYRLPTEAEWEYACRAGTTSRYSCGNELDRQSAWSSDNSDDQPHPVGEKRPNAWGLYDMHGNVCEWCGDRFAIDYYENAPLDDPAGPETGSYRMIRGGSWSNSAGYCRSARRQGYWPAGRLSSLGFRVALVPAD